jgi:CPA2 family monovalent cation:H+ antiporter-2
MNVDSAAAIIVAIDNMEKKRLICEAILKRYSNVNLVVQVMNSKEREMLSDLKISTIIEAQKEVAKIIVNDTMICHI